MFFRRINTILLEWGDAENTKNNRCNIVGKVGVPFRQNKQREILDNGEPSRHDADSDWQTTNNNMVGGMGHAVS